MSVEVVDLSTLSQTSVDQFQSQIDTLIQAYRPLVDVTGGAFEDLLIHLNAVLSAATQENIDLVRQSNSLQQVNANPLLADPTILALLLSNYNLIPNPGTESSGVITIVLNQFIGTVIPQGSLFTINGLTFSSPVSYAVRTSPSQVIAPTDVLLTQIGTNQYVFSITLDATAVGTAGNVMRGTAVTPSQLPAAFVNAYVQSDFTGGTNASTNQQLLTQLASGLAIGAWSNRVSNQSLITKQTAFANISNMSSIGFGDPEMLRDQHAIWPGSSGGRTDLYLRSQPLYQYLAFTVTATLISRTGPVGTWQFGITKNQAPGFYKVTNILFPDEAATDTGFTPSSDVRGFDLTGVSNPPDIISAQEGTYSRFQTAVIQFVDTITDATALVINTSTQQYQVVVQVMPLIDSVQDFLLGRSVAPPMCDVEVKAPIPVYTVVTCTVNYATGTTTPVVATLQTDIANAVNSLNFPGTLAASFIDQVIHNLYSNVVSVTGFTLQGTIRSISGATATFSSSTSISVPVNYTLMQSGRTAVFFVEPNNVNITLVAV